MSKLPKRFFTTSSLTGLLIPDSVPIILSREESHYLRHVLRMTPGASCFVFDRSGNEYLCRLETVDQGGRCVLKPLEQKRQDRPLGISLTVAPALAKRRKMDMIVEKAGELGVDTLIPMVTERTIVRMTKDQEKKVSARWQKILVQTLQQSRLTWMPSVAPVQEFCDVIGHRTESAPSARNEENSALEKQSNYDHILLLHPSQNALPLGMRTGFAPHARVLLMIGPEGGFSDDEVEQARKNGAQPVSLNTGILKTDTAFVAAVSIVKALSIKRTSDGTA